MVTYARTFAEFSDNLSWNRLPKDVALRIKSCVLDVLGICLAASKQRYARAIAQQFIDAGGAPQSSVLGRNARLPMASAALINGSFSHGIEFDDSHLAAAMHPSSVIVPACLAVAEARRSTGRQFLEAVAAGLEVMIRIGKAGHSAEGFHHRGLHPTSLAGVFGAALAASKLLGLSSDECVWSQGLAGSMASGSTEFLQDISWGKRMAAGWAAHGGVIAAQLAQRGFTAPSTIYEGRWGLYESHLRVPNYSLAPLAEGLGSNWEATNLIARRYPCCARIPPFISATLSILQSEGLTWPEIQAIEIGAQTGDSIVCDPWSAKLEPADGYAAQFSLPYCVAATVRYGRLTMSEFDEAALSDSELKVLMGRLTHWTGSLDDSRGHLLVRTFEGRMIERTVAVELPMSWAEIQDKFLAIAADAIGASDAARIVRMVKELEDLPDIGALANSCQSASRHHS